MFTRGVLRYCVMTIVSFLALLSFSQIIWRLGYCKKIYAKQPRTVLKSAHPEDFKNVLCC